MTIITNIATLEQLTVYRKLNLVEITEILDRSSWDPADCIIEQG